jgi:hypothetical protein
MRVGSSLNPREKILETGGEEWMKFVSYEP